MSHEIRTPLNAMLGLAQLGRRGGSLQMAPAQAFERILRAGRHLQGVINDVLDFTRIESGKLTVELLPVRLASLVKDAMDLVSDRAVEKGLDLKWSSDGVPTHVLLDPLRVSQVLVNLMANAIKFTEQGSVTLLLERRGEQLCIAVRDTGPGILPEHQERIFSAFEQADSSTTRKYGGSGLGLAISRRQVEAMGGSLSVHSVFGQGATFTVLLPLLEVEAPLNSTAAGAEERDLTGLKVLVVDDVDINREILQDMLSHFGVVSVQAASGEEAIETVRASGPGAFDLVLMDVQMPRVDGYQAAAIVRTIDPDLPMVAVTAHAMAAHRQHSMDAGMKDHLNKPVDIDALRSCIARVVPPGPFRHTLTTSAPTAGTMPAGAATAMALNVGTEAMAASPSPTPISALAAVSASASAPAASAATSLAADTHAGAAPAAVLPLTSAEPAAGGSSTDPWPDLPEADFPAALKRCAGQQALLHKLLRQFIRFYVPHETLFDEAQAGGLTVLQSAAHRLKGASSNLGMMGLAAQAHALERACAEPSAQSTVPSTLADLQVALQAHLLALQAWLPPEPSASA